MMQNYDQYLRRSEESPSVRGFRDIQKRNIDYSQEEKGKVPFFRSLHRYTTGLPPLHCMPEEFRRELSRQLIDLDIEYDLKTSKVINWCKDAPKVFPVQTASDGNCLLHAISQGLWGVSDEELSLRNLLYLSICNETFSLKVKQRWLAKREQEEKQISQQIGMNIPEQEITSASEWDKIKQMAGGRASTRGLYTFLEAVHIYIMANILRRPIIIYSKRIAESVGGEALQENHLSGIYLPLEWDEKDCYKYPLAIAFHLNHFTPLMFREEIPKSDRKLILPLVSHDLEPLIVHFLLPNEEKNILNVLKKYLNFTELNSKSSRTVIPVLCAEVKQVKLPDNYNSMIPFVKYNENRYRESLYSEFHTPLPRISSRTEVMVPTTKCVTPGCDFSGTPNTAGMCSKCFLEFTKKDRNNLNSITYTAASSEMPSKNVQLNIFPEPTAPPPSHPEQEHFVDLSLMGEKCNNNCGLRCSTKTYPYCHECYEKIVSDVKMQRLCKTSECPNSSRPGQSGLCDSCYNKKYGLEYTEQNTPHLKPLKISFPPKDVLLQMNMDLQGPSGRTGTEHSINDLSSDPSGPEQGLQTLPRTQVCSNPICIERAQRNEMNVCSKCFLSNSKQNMLVCTPELYSTGTNKPENLYQSGQQRNLADLMKNSYNNYSAPVSLASKFDVKTESSQAKSLPLQKKTVSTQTKYLCCIPGCNGIRLTAANNVDRCWSCWIQAQTELSRQLCPPSFNNEHSAFNDNQEVLGNQQPGSFSPLQGTSLVESAPSLSIQRCVFSGCNNVVNRPNMLCNNCQAVLFQAKQQKDGHDLSQNTPIPPAANLISNHDEIPELIGAPCHTPGCSRFGDVSQDGYCSNCYQRNRTRTQENRVGHDPAAETLIRVENQMKGKKCRHDWCLNFGNSKSFGFCNTCYQDYLKDVTGKLVH